MSLAPEITLRVSTRPVGVGERVGGPGASAATVLHAIGSRSEAVRLAPVIATLGASGVNQIVARLVGPDDADEPVVDGSGVPRTELLIDRSVAVTEVQRTARALALAERTLDDDRPVLLILAGDADTTLAFALAAAKLGVPIARVGAGLRSGDFSASDEINRVLGDRLADVLFTDGPASSEALQIEGIARDRIHIVGNPALDLVHQHQERAERRATWRRYGLQPGGYVLAALHRPENVHDDERLASITHALARVARRTSVLMPLHPVAYERLEAAGEIARLRDAGVHVTLPQAYINFLSLQQTANAIVTDSGAVQEEATALGVPCYTLLRMTERVATLTHGTNVLVGTDPDDLEGISLAPHGHLPGAIPLWDGSAARRIAEVVRHRLASHAQD